MKTETNSNEDPGDDLFSPAVVYGYRAHPAIANSDLKYLHSPRMFQLNKSRQLQEEETKSLSFGTLIDEYLLTPDTFHDKYIMQPDMETPGHANQHKFVEKLITLYRDEIEDVPDEEVSRLYGECYSKPDDKKAINLYKTLLPYIKFQIEREGKKVYTQDDWDKLQNIHQGCLDHVLVRDLLFTEKKNRAVLTQLEAIDVEIWGVNWKGKFDLVVIDFDDHVIWLIDLKTTSKPLSSFGWEIKKYRYYRQLALYRELVTRKLVKMGVVPAEELATWTVKTRILAVESTPIHEVGLIPLPEEVLQLGITELKEAAEDIKYYNKVGWHQRKSYLQNGYLEIIDWTKVFDEL